MPSVGLLSTADAARALGVTPRTVQRLVERGELTPAYRGSGRTSVMLFRPAALSRLITERHTDETDQ